LGETRFAVVGHVEWVHFARVPRIPRPGEVAHAREAFEEPAGGGAVAAVQLARLAGACLLITALGHDELGERSRRRLHELGVEVQAVARNEPTRSAFTLLDDAGERTITTLGRRLEPSIDDPELDWSRLARFDAVYFTAGDTGALAAARAARCLIASPRAREALRGGIELDALVLSARDMLERQAATEFEGQARIIALTEGERGGSYRIRGGAGGGWEATRLAAVDSYGCGDSFAAGLTFALGAGWELEAALSIAAGCGARCATGRGPYEHQLRGAELPAPNRHPRGDAGPPL
jgi:ribokinase